MVQILEMVFAHASEVEDLFCGDSSGPDFSLGFNTIQDDCHHDFARMTDEAYSSLDLTDL